MNQADPRPRSAVSSGVGLVGLAGLVGWLIVGRMTGLDGVYAALVALLACGVPMVLWSLLVDRVHRNPSTGIDWSLRRSASATREISIVKLTGLWATWAIIAVLYFLGRWYWDGQYLFSMTCFMYAVPALLLLSIPYVLWIDRRLVEPRDGAWHFGRLLLGDGSDVDRAVLADHFRAWGVKAFFLAFMLSIVPGVWGEVVSPSSQAILGDQVSLIRWLISTMFLADVMLATVGYMLTMKPLDAHIRSANPYAAGWMAALICYPPFILMGGGGPLDYHPGTLEWTAWLWSYPVLTLLVGIALVVLTAIYAWATVAFGLRFSNLTHRGILTHGPYRWTKHPAYLSKNAFWWLATMPFFGTLGIVEATRATLLLAIVSGVYYWRAKTEERHLMADPAYRDYAEWIDRNGLFAILRRLLGRERRQVAPAE